MKIKKLCEKKRPLEDNSVAFFDSHIILPYMQAVLFPKKDLKHFKRYTHGGVSLKKRRKIERPLLPGQITHVVFKSAKAKGRLSFYSQKNQVHRRLRERAKKYFVEVIDYVNMGNHLHLKVRCNDTDKLKNFLRTFAALLARDITGARKGQPFGKFWDGLVFTRVLMSKFEQLSLRGYFEGNHRQRELGYQERVEYLKRFNQFLYRLKATRAAPA
jgi:hypothetical protein